MRVVEVERRLENTEGRSNWMYKCTGGKVTAAIGHAFETPDEAQACIWMIGQRRATPAEIADDHRTVAAAPAGQAAHTYAKLTRCRMPDTEINRLNAADIDEVTAQLRSRIRGFNAMPDQVQEALFDMCFNLGAAGLIQYRQMLLAIYLRDYETAARESHRQGISDARNAEIAELLRSAGPRTSEAKA